MSKRRVKYSYVLTVVLLLFGCHSNDHHKLTILFDNVEGLKEGSGVFCKNIKIGEVVYMNLYQDKVQVDVNLSDTILIPIGSSFLIHRSLVNPAHITIEPTSETTFLRANDTVLGYYNTEQSFDDLIPDSVRQKRIETAVKKISEGFGELIEANKKPANNK